MDRNVEVKARAVDFPQQQKIASTLANTQAKTLIQEDTFFHVEQGRLKLREFPDAPSQLIFYRRDSVDGPKLSEYYISESHDGEGLKSVLEKAYGIRHVVKKTRTLYLTGRTRIHFDKVEDLGDFIELEVVLTEEEPISDGESEAEQIMKQLGIHKEHLIDVAYVDLLERIV